MSVRVRDPGSTETRDVSPAEAAKGIAAGTLEIAQDSVKVKRAGQTGSVSPEDLSKSLAHGWELTDEEGAKAARLVIDAYSVPGLAVGAAEAAAAGATVGLSTALEDALGVDMEAAAARREALGGVGTGLEVAGAVAPALLSGGTSLAGRAAAALPAAAIERGAVRLGGAAAKNLASPLARRVVSTGVTGGVEGVFAGAGAQLDDDLLGNHEINADRLAMAGGLGAILGFGGGAGLGLAAHGGSKLLRAGSDALTGAAQAAGPAARVLRNAVGDISNDAPRAFERAFAEGNIPMIAKLTGTPEAVWSPIAPLARTTEGQALLRELMTSTDDHLERMLSATRGPTADIQAAVVDIRKALSSEMRAKTMPDIADPQQRLSAVQAARELAYKVEGRAERLAAQGDDLGGAYDKPSINRIAAAARVAQSKLDPIARRADDALAKGKVDVSDDDIRAAYAATNTLKQHMQTVQSQVARSASGPTPPTSAQLTRDLFRRGGPDDIDLGLEDVRDFLENEQFWAAAAVGQKEANAATRSAILMREELKSLSPASARVLDPDRPILRDEDLLKVIQRTGTLKGEQSTEKFLDAIAAERNAAQTALRHYDSPELAAAAKKLDDAQSVWVKAVDQQRATRQIVDSLKILKDHHGQGLLSNPSALLLTAAGGMMGGGEGATLGAAAGMLRNPYMLLRGYLGVMKTLDDGASKYLSGVAKFAAKAGGKVKGAAKVVGDAVGAAAPTVGRGIRAATTKAAGMGAAEKREQSRKLATAVAHLSAAPGVLVDQVGRATAELAGVSPRTAAVVSDRAVGSVAFLASKLPVTFQPPLGGPALVDPVGEAKWMRYAEVVLDPAGVMAKIATGTFSLEHAEAMSVLMPALWADLQDRVLDIVASSPRPPYAVRITSGIIMGSRETDPTLSPQFIALAQASFNPPPPPPAAPGQKARASGAKPPGVNPLPSAANRIEQGIPP